MQRTRGLRIGVAVLLAGCISAAARAEPAAGGAIGWRGDGSGHYPRAEPPLLWSAGRNVLWRARAGKGRSSPLVVGERVYVTAEPDRLLCLAAGSGKVLWRSTSGAKDLPAEMRGGELEPPTECGYATPTPCSDGRRVYALFGTGVVACHDLAGRRRWIRRMRIIQTEEHGRSASPVLVAGRLIVHVTDLFCLDARTGEVLWRQAAKPAFGTPLAARIGGDDVIVTPEGGVFRVRDGRKLAAEIGSLAVASPVAHDGVVYFIGSVARAVRLPAGPVGDGPLAAAELWRVELPGEFYASPIVHGGLIYAVGREGHFLVLDARTGRTVLSRKLKVKSECAPSLCLAGGRLLVCTDGGASFVFEPGRACRQLAANVPLKGSVATPAFSGKRVFLRAGRDVLCVQAAAGGAAAPAKHAAATPTRPAAKPSTRPVGAIAATAPLLPEGVLMGWRGNGTGLYADATPVLTWRRTCQGVAAGLKISAANPAGDAPGRAKPLRNHFPREWLVIGPFPAPKGLDTAALPDESAAGPAEGERIGDRTWTRYEVAEDVMPPAERGSVAGAMSLRPVDPGKALGGFKAGQLVYAHTYLHAARAGEVEIIVDHAVGLRAWMNGREVYRKKSAEFRISWYHVLSKFRTLAYAVSPSPRFRVRLEEGWNRLLLKLAHGRGNHNSYRFNPRIVDLPDAPCEVENILWAAPLPDRSNATPVIVGDRIFVMAEPEQLICLDKLTGRQLWTRFLGRYQATPQADRDANATLRETLEPLAARLPQARGLRERLALRRQIDAALVSVDARRYRLKWDGHMAAHFRIVGWTVPTPCSDGRYVYVYCGNGVAACYDLTGRTRWIRRVNPGELHYPASPALVDGRFVVFAAGGFNLVGLDAATGSAAWRQPAVNQCVGALIGARINGVGVVLSQKGDVVRAADGRLLYANPLRKASGDTGWAPPTCLDGVVYLPWQGIGTLMVNDFRAAAGESWACRSRRIGGLAVSRNSKGTWVDRWTCGSPLIHEGIYYNIDVFGTLLAADVKTGKVLYRRDLSGEFDMLTHYTAVGVAASVTLGGRHLFAMDNQGTTVVFEPGRTFRKVAVNRIERQIDRPWPIRPQEEIGYSPPLFEGRRMYLRGERYLYCIAKP